MGDGVSCVRVQGGRNRDIPGDPLLWITGERIDPVVLMCLADDILGPDAEAIVPRVPEGVGQVVSRAGH